MRRLKENNRKSFHVFIPLMLITFGVLFLWQNLNRQQERGWWWILDYWPLILIFGGLEFFINRKGAAVPVFWIALGAGLLMSNLGRIYWTFWEIVFTLWPLLIIAVGLDLITGDKNYWARLTAAGLVLLLIGGVTWYFDTQPLSDRSARTSITQERGNIGQAEIKINQSIGFLKIHAQSSESVLVEGDLKLWQGERIKQTMELENERGVYLLTSSGLPYIYEPGIENRANWNLGISSRLPIILKIQQTIGEVDLESASLILEDLSIQSFWGVSRISLAPGSHFPGKVEQLIGRIVILVPEGAEVLITGRPKIGVVDVPEAFIKDGERIYSPGFYESKNQVELDLRMAVGQIILKQR